jgi:hypothetical protein
MAAITTGRNVVNIKREASTLRNESKRATINWDAVPDSVMRMLASALLEDHKIRQDKAKAQYLQKEGGLRP